MKKNNNNSKQGCDFAVGDKIKVKKGIKDLDIKEEFICGWEGEIIEIKTGENDKNLLEIEWNYKTLKNMPEKFIEMCALEGLDYTKMNLYPEDVKKFKYIEEDHINKSKEKLLQKYSFYDLGEQGKRIIQVLAYAMKNDIDVFAAWQRFLERKLKFPFAAVVSEYQNKGPLAMNDEVSVKRISDYGYDDLYGIIVELRKGRKKYAFPLCDLKVIDQDSQNYKLVYDYVVWFANR